MNRDDKLLYHQIHPGKLAVDIATSAVSSWLLWRGQLWLALLVGWLPSVIVTAAMVRWMDFSRQRDSRFGRYVAHHMTRQATALRLAGQLVMWLAAWFHVAWGVAAGTLIVIAGWTYSLPSWRARARGGPAPVDPQGGAGQRSGPRRVTAGGRWTRRRRRRRGRS